MWWLKRMLKFNHVWQNAAQVQGTRLKSKPSNNDLLIIIAMSHKACQTSSNSTFWSTPCSAMSHLLLVKQTFAAHSKEITEISISPALCISQMVHLISTITFLILVRWYFFTSNGPPGPFLVTNYPLHSKQLNIVISGVIHCCYLPLILQPNILQGVTQADMLIWLWKQPLGHFLYLGVLGVAMLLMLLKHGTNNNWWLTHCGLETPYGDIDLVQHWLSINWDRKAWCLFNANPWSKPVMINHKTNCFQTLMDQYLIK